MAFLAWIVPVQGGGGYPDQGLPPGQGGYPSHPIYQPPYPSQGPGFPTHPIAPGGPPVGIWPQPPGQPPYPSQGLPPYPSQGLPPGQGGYPSQGLPPYPNQGLPGGGPGGGGYPSGQPIPPNAPPKPTTPPPAGSEWELAFLPGQGWTWVAVPVGTTKPNPVPPDQAAPKGPMNR